MKVLFWIVVCVLLWEPIAIAIIGLYVFGATVVDYCQHPPKSIAIKQTEGTQ